MSTTKPDLLIGQPAPASGPASSLVQYLRSPEASIPKPQPKVRRLMQRGPRAVSGLCPECHLPFGHLLGCLEVLKALPAEGAVANG